MGTIKERNGMEQKQKILRSGSKNTQNYTKRVKDEILGWHHRLNAHAFE